LRVVYDENDSCIPYVYINKRSYANLIREHDSWEIRRVDNIVFVCYADNVYYHEASLGHVEAFGVWENNMSGWTNNVPRGKFPKTALAFNTNRAWQRDIVETCLLRDI